MLSALRSLARSLFRRSRLEDDLAAEMRFHLDAYTADLVRQGVPAEEARRRARIEFGSLESNKQECRESKGLRWPDEFARNVRYAFRTLGHSPGFALAAILTLALCIGANTAIFSVIDAALLRPLPYPEPGRLAHIVTQFRSPSATGINTSEDGETWQLLRDHATGLELAAMSGGFIGVNLAYRNKAQYVEQSRVTAGYFHVLGVPPAIGREFSSEEDRTGGPTATILSHDLWMRLFHGDAGVVGQTVLLRGEPHTIAGVMPASFRPIMQADLWTPLRPSTTGEGGGDNYMLLGRLRPGTTFAQASGELQSLGQSLFDRHKKSPGTTARLAAIPLQEGLSDELRSPLYVLWAAVGLVLLIGCLNIAGLMLVRATARTREIATRVALGGGQGAVIRQLLTESLVIAILGGTVGAALGYGGIRMLSIVAADSLGVWQQLRLDWRVLLMTAILSVVTSIIFGLLPAIQAARLDIRAGLSEGGARGIAGGSSRWPRRLLVFGEVALGMVLLVGAGLMTRTFLNLRHLSPGFDGAGVLTASLSLQDARYTDAQRANRLFNETLDRIRALPGVESAAIGLHVPYERWLNLNFQRTTEIGTGAHSTITSVNYVTPGYFGTLRIPLLAGRDFDLRDSAGAPPVAIVNHAFATQYLKQENPIGTRVVLAGGKTPLEIVAVAGDLQQRPGWNRTAPLTESPALYIPAAQVSGSFMQLVHTWFAPKWIVRAAGPRQPIIEGMRAAVEQIDPLLPFAGFKTLEDLRDLSLSSQRLQALLLGSLAGLALVLATVGVYALIANSVAQRTREMGIRMALGASLDHVVLSLALPGLLLAAGGVAAGAVLAALSVRVIQSSIYGIAALDPATFIGVGVVLILVAAAASFLPALKLMRLNPASTLRDE